MAKITAADIVADGFTALVFGTPADFAQYLDPVIQEAGDYVAARVGAERYETAAGGVLVAVRNAERAYAAGLLWLRRAAFIDSNAASSLERQAFLDRREFEASSARAFERAEEWISRAQSDALSSPAGTGVALAYAESGPFRVQPA